MRILLLSPNSLGLRSWGHQRFLNDLALTNDVVYYGRGHKGYNQKLTVPNIVKKYGKFDIILTNHLGWQTAPLMWSYKVNIPHVHLLLDYYYKLPKKHRRFKRYRFNLLLVRTSGEMERLKKNNITIKSRLFPFSVDTKVYKKQEVEKIYDVITSSSGSKVSTSKSKSLYPYRHKIVNLVNGTGLKAMTEQVIHFDYIKAINQSKIAIISNDFLKSLHMKYTEFLSCGTFVLADKPEDFEICGYKNKEHLVLYKDLQDLEKLIRYYLDHSEEREQIAKQGMEFVRQNHSNEVRVKEMTDIIMEELII